MKTKHIKGVGCSQDIGGTSIALHAYTRSKIMIQASTTRNFQTANSTQNKQIEGRNTSKNRNMKTNRKIIEKNHCNQKPLPED